MEVSKILYNSIKLNSYNLKKIKENFFSGATNNENDVIKNTFKDISNNDRFNKIFNYRTETNARIATSEITGLNIERINAELNSSSITDKVRGKIIQFGNELTTLKAKLNENNVSDPTSVKNEIDKLVSSFESNVVSDNSLSLDEKTILFAVTVATLDNLENIKQLITGKNSGGRKGCFFCNVVNVFVTIVVAAAIISLVATIVVAAAVLAVEGIVAATVFATAAAFGASMGAVVGVLYTVTDNCLYIVDYGQPIYGSQLEMVFSQC